MIASQIFKRGDIVRTVLGGPAMFVGTVQHDDGKPDIVSCTWFNTQHELREMPFRADMLLKSERPS